MNEEEFAKEFYLCRGYNCCESVLLSFKESNILSVPDEILCSFSGFFRGIIGSGCICGVVIAGCFLIGFKFGKDRQEVERRTKAFFDRFKGKFGSVCCRVLTKNYKENFYSKDRKNYCAEIISQMTLELKEILK
ncbi:MAG: C-GCAxxG-C-C family protein [Endomicrobia bacterium]|nr:C-GCAxxG-C-C family protein [Endomicrobiia bacterium]MDW8056458.1 C-GCAxxG-C-C family protein [Elusimicrobiota bacterium]